ncbi:MAG: sensor domain-containing diguanylate cyclase [Planctomycetota bacterium]
MTARKPVVVLTRDEPNLEHYLQMLEDEGWSVFAAAGPVEAAVLLARRPGALFVARASLLPGSVAEFLDDLRAHAEPERCVLSTRPGDGAPRAVDGDVVLEEPFSYAQLLRALGVDEDDGGHPRDRRGDGDLAGLPPVYRVVHYAREFSELERDREALLDRALDAAMALVSARRGSLMLREADRDLLRVVRHAGFPEEPSGDLFVKRGEPVAGSVLASDEPFLAEDIRKIFPDRPPRGYDTDSCLVVPIRDRNATLGVINLADPSAARTFSREDLVHVMMLADQLATTMANAETLRELQELTVIDPLTLLYNRRHFDRQLAREIERARRYGRPLTLALLDIDDFKGLNDRNGYSIGDKVIRLVAERIRDTFRDSDIVTRWGGDKFAVILPETGRPIDGGSSRASFIDRVRDAVSTLDFRRAIPELDASVTPRSASRPSPIDARGRRRALPAGERRRQGREGAGGDRTCPRQRRRRRGERVLSS